jgi:hypothetical protein
MKYKKIGFAMGVDIQCRYSKGCLHIGKTTLHVNNCSKYIYNIKLCG